MVLLPSSNELSMSGTVVGKFVIVGNTVYVLDRSGIVLDLAVVTCTTVNKVGCVVAEIMELSIIVFAK